MSRGKSPTTSLARSGKTSGVSWIRLGISKRVSRFLIVVARQSKASTSPRAVTQHEADDRRRCCLSPSKRLEAPQEFSHAAIGRRCLDRGRLHGESTWPNRGPEQSADRGTAHMTDYTRYGTRNNGLPARICTTHQTGYSIVWKAMRGFCCTF